MKQKSDCVCRQIIDKSDKNWKRISFNDFGVRYSNFLKKKIERENVSVKSNPNPRISEWPMPGLICLKPFHDVFRIKLKNLW